MNYRRTGSTIFAGLIALALVAIWGIPAAADLDLVSGDDAKVAYTDGDGVNVHSEPGIDMGIVTTLPEAYAVTILDGPLTLDDGLVWYAIATDTNEGWIEDWVIADYLTAYSDGVDVAAPSTPSGTGMVVSAGGDGLNLRAGASLGSEIIDVIPDGYAVGWLADAGTDAEGIAWSEIIYGGTYGYAATVYLVNQSDAGSAELAGVTTATGSGDAIVEAALDYLGTVYLWSGATPEGFDCSGFTYYILNQVLGYDFPRPIEVQIVSGSYVAMEDLAPGDLIFFENTYQPGLSHVGFYIGDGQFVSATGQFDAVGISSLDDPYWGSRYLTARSID